MLEWINWNDFESKIIKNNGFKVFPNPFNTSLACILSNHAKKHSTLSELDFLIEVSKVY